MSKSRLRGEEAEHAQNVHVLRMHCYKLYFLEKGPLVSQHFTKFLSISWSKMHFIFFSTSKRKILCTYVIDFRLSQLFLLYQDKRITYYYFFLSPSLSFLRTKGGGIFHRAVCFYEYSPLTKQLRDDEFRLDFMPHSLY